MFTLLMLILTHYRQQAASVAPAAPIAAANDLETFPVALAA